MIDATPSSASTTKSASRTLSYQAMAMLIAIASFTGFPKKSDTLALCRVQVFGEAVNLGARQTAVGIQSQMQIW